MIAGRKGLRWRSRQEARRAELEKSLHEAGMRDVERAVSLDRLAVVRFALDVIACNRAGEVAAERTDGAAPRKVFEVVDADGDRPAVRLVGVLSDDEMMCEICRHLGSLAIYDLIEPAVPAWMGLEIHWCSGPHGYAHGHLEIWHTGTHLAEARL